MRMSQSLIKEHSCFADPLFLPHLFYDSIMCCFLFLYTNIQVRLYDFHIVAVGHYIWRPGDLRHPGALWGKALRKATQPALTGGQRGRLPPRPYPVSLSRFTSITFVSFHPIEGKKVEINLLFSEKKESFSFALHRQGESRKGMGAWGKGKVAFSSRRPAGAAL